MTLMGYPYNNKSPSVGHIIQDNAFTMARVFALLAIVTVFAVLVVREATTKKVKKASRELLKDRLKETVKNITAGERVETTDETIDGTTSSPNDTSGVSEEVVNDTDISGNYTSSNEPVDESDATKLDSNNNTESKRDNEEIIRSVVNGVKDVANEIADKTLPSISYFVTSILSKLRSVEPSLIPVHDMNDTLDLFIDVKILSLTSFDEISGEVALVTSMRMRWDTANTPRWDPFAHMRGKMAVPIDSNMVWRPKLLLLNPANDVQDLTQLSDKMRLGHNGTVEWNIVSSIQASCPVDISLFPFDTQICTINIATWGYTSSEINIIGSFRRADVPFFRENSVWELLDLYLETGTDEDVALITIGLRLKRHWQFFMINILLAPLLLSFLSPCVFLLPARSGERISFSITCFLAFGVFSSLLADNIPRSSSPVARLCYLLMNMTLQSFGVAFCTILSLRMYSEGDNVNVPASIQTVFKVFRRGRVDPQKNIHAEECPNSDIRRLTTKSVTEPSNRIDNEKRDMKPLDSLVIDEEKDVSVGETEVRDSCISWRDIAHTMDYIFFVVFTGSMLTSIVVASYFLFK